MNQQRLYEILDTYFNLSELSEICFTLQIDFEHISGHEKRAKVRAFIQYCVVQQRIPELLQLLSDLRPHLAKELSQPFSPPATPTFFESDPIPWDLVKQICQEKNARHADILREKYDPTLYVERMELYHHVEVFLDTPTANYLVLRGRSGTGKTGFLSNLHNRWLTNPDIACLVYDCKSLQISDREAGKDLLDLLARGLLPQPDRILIDQWLNRIESDTQFDTSKHRLVLIADAINESKNMPAIAAWLTQLQIDRQRPWLKIIISCRPHVWKSLTQLVFAGNTESEYGLARTHFYQPENMGQRFVEMGDFSNEEAREAYHLHQIRFKLSPTNYEDLEPEVQQRLKEPLLLWLVSYICSNKNQMVSSRAIGSDIFLIPAYVKARLKRDELDEEEIRKIENFLQEELPQQMVDKGKCRNTIPTEDITRQLGEQRFHLERLLRMGLLEETALQHISFRYERFYDYYFGWEIRKRAQNDIALGCIPTEGWTY
ncbi:MAG TPA: NACHT domain-containing protein [Chloroflexota bacterium]|nr:NACHT domain-containing protein [Chloroflexota bacterium]HUM67534.1 NACHT domain-containing protein [Chloroflexota bacterium]